MRSTILVNVKTSTLNSTRNFYIVEWGRMGTFSIGMKFVHLSSYTRKMKKIEPQEFEIFQFKNCKKKYNPVLILK